MTEKTLDWLNANRFRAYPFVNDSGLVQDGKSVPNCLLLDCLVFDTRHLSGIPDLVFTKMTVSDDSTSVEFRYGTIPLSCTLSGGEVFGAKSVVTVRSVAKIPDSDVHFRLVFSSHAYIRDSVGVGSWTFAGRVLPTKVVSVTASGVSGIQVSGSEGEDPGGIATGTVVLKDGYRTMPTIRNGKVVVRVGQKYGEDPCHHNWGSERRKVDCDKLMLFFCGQTGDSSGNVNLTGGPGVSVLPGSEYAVKRGFGDLRPGERVPCIEIKATSELLRIYAPTVEPNAAKE